MNLRNKLCACGSGKKTKRCCGDPVAENQRFHEAQAKQLEIVKQRAAEREARISGPTVQRPRSMGALLPLMLMSAALGAGIPIRRR